MIFNLGCNKSARVLSILIRKRLGGVTTVTSLSLIHVKYVERAQDTNEEVRNRVLIVTEFNTSWMSLDITRKETTSPSKKTAHGGIYQITSQNNINRRKHSNRYDDISRMQFTVGELCWQRQFYSKSRPVRAHIYLSRN